MKSGSFIIFAAVAFATELTCAGNLHAGLSGLPRWRFSMATLGSLSAAPGTIGFQAANPDAGRVSGSSSATVTWLVLSGAHSNNWTVTVQAASSSATGCSTVPASAIEVSCNSATVSGGAGTGACGGSFPLSTTAQQVAGGAEGNGSNSYSVALNFTLAESWRYVANSLCPLTITYSVNAP